MALDSRYQALTAHIGATPALSGLSGQALLDALNAPAGMVPAPMYFADLTAMVSTGTVSPASFLKVWNHARFDRFYSDVTNQNVFAMIHLYPSVFVMDGTITEAEAGAFVAYASRTVPGGPTVAQGIAGWGVSTVTLADLAAIGRDA